MKVACPHCAVALSIDDRRVPPAGVSVRCPSCRNVFPVRKGEGGGEDAVPLPAPGAPADAPTGAIPLPTPGALAGAPAGGAIPLPAPSGGALVPPPPTPEGVAIPLPAPEAGSRASAPVEPPPPAGEAPPFAPSESPGDVTIPDLSTPEPLPLDTSDPIGFGEVDLGAEEPAPAAQAKRASDPFGGSPPPPPPLSSARPEPTTTDDLEMLFGEGASPKPAPSDAGGRYRVRRRSGKIFGPFEVDEVVQMLEKGELLGNEDASPAGQDAWTPLASVPAFGETLRKLTAEPTPSPSLEQGVPFGDRMASAKVVEGTGQVEGRRRPAVAVVAAAALAAILLVGFGAGLTSFGIFFHKAFRGGDPAKLAANLAEARTALERADYPADRAALDAASRAVAADPSSPEAVALQANAVAILEQRHGAPPAALEQARAGADRLDADAKGKISALEARLAVTLATLPGAATASQETALEQAAARAAPDADVLALLARSALARGDAQRAASLFARLEALKPGTPRGAFGTGLALAAKHDGAGARAAFEKVLALSPGHLPAHLELAALAEASGDLAGAEAQLAPLLEKDAEPKLAPAERARALALRGSLLAAGGAKKADEADRALEQAVAADPRLLEPRLALARLRLRRGDAAGALAALDPVAAQAPTVPALGALRIRTLAAAGRALDASSLADKALQKSPGDPLLLLAKAYALESSGKFRDAAGLFRDAAARDPAAFEPRLALGRIALAGGDLAAAKVELAAAVEKGPREPAAHALLGDMAAAGGDAAQAQQEYQAALALDPEYAPAEIGVARLAIARGDTARARALLEKAVAVDPKNVDARVQYGTLLWRARELAPAEATLQAAVDLQPTNALANSRLGAVKLERGEDVAGAVQRLSAAVAEDERLTEARLWLGRALLKKGETAQAVTTLRKAVELEPKNAEDRLHLAIALERSGALQEAVEEYRTASSLDPKLAEAPERLGALFAANNRFEDAAAAYEKAIAAAPRTASYRIALGDARAKLGKYDEAIKLYRELLKMDPRAVQAYYPLARAIHESQGAKAALPFYERAAKEDRENAMPHYYLGYLYKERRQKARAADEFKRFLKLKPDADEKKDIESEIEDLGGGK